MNMKFELGCPVPPNSATQVYKHSFLEGVLRVKPSCLTPLYIGSPS